MASASPIDDQFYRAVDLVQSLPKSGPIQTTYEEKLQLYSLYKQATDGDISTPRPGMLDMLGRAKWDSWNKQRGVDKADAKQMYVAALMKIFQRYEDRETDARRFIAELQAMAPLDRAASPASSTSSFHSSRASPPPEVAGEYALPDPSLPAPDVPPNIIPPSDLTTSHRSLVSLQQQQQQQQQQQHHQQQPYESHTPYTAPSVLPGGPFAAGGSRPQSLFSGMGGSVREPLQSLRMRQQQSLGYVPEGSMPGPSHTPQSAHIPPRAPSLPPPFLSRDFGTPDLPHLQGSVPPLQGSPYIPSPGYPQRPISASTFSHAPLNLPATLQQIHTSLQALHERLTALERSQAMILRKEDRRRSWFWSNHSEDELDDAELDAERERWAYNPNSTTIRIRKKKGLTVRVIWALITALRRAAIGVGATVLVAWIAIALMNGGLRRQLNASWRRLRVRIVKALSDA